MQYYKYYWLKASTQETCLLKTQGFICSCKWTLEYRNYVLVWEDPEVKLFS